MMLGGIAVYLFNVPEHGNLGDHAITYATEIFCQKNLPSVKIEKITNAMWNGNCEKLKNNIPANAWICISGGGFLGTLWMNEEAVCRSVIQAFPNNPILILPQTIYYEDDNGSQSELSKSISIYNAHSNLTICARERITYLFVKEHFINASTYLIPDMVLFLQPLRYSCNRRGVLFCLRKDKEKTAPREKVMFMKQVLQSANFSVNEMDTVIPHTISQTNRNAELLNKFSEFGSAELVITDRLHGMIFAAVTETPCIVVNSKSPKVRGVYEWIKDLTYVRFLDKYEEFPNLYKELLSSHGQYENKNLMPYYEELARIFKGDK